MQIYIARSRIEDFLSLSFWGNARTLRHWDDQLRPSNEELLEVSRSMVSADGGGNVRKYFESEMESFYYLVFSPVVRITESMAKRPAYTRQGEYKILPELTSFIVHFPGFDQASCVASVRLFEVERNLIFKDEYSEITNIFNSRRKEITSENGVVYEFTHYNHDNRDQLELYIEYVKDGRQVTGDEGLRIILNGNDVKELGINERLTFEL